MDLEPTLEERLHTNYNTVGVAVMQAMYSADYLSIGGTESTTELAELAGLTAASRVIDLGCGVGGPALHLAESIGCAVTGVDLVESNIHEARRRAADRQLSTRTSFQHGDATAVDFADGLFDVVWGQDAWCHVPDKPALLAEARRLLQPDGTVAFTDWLAGEGMTVDARRSALDAALCGPAASADHYLAMLTEAGFTDIRYTDISETFLRQYESICSGLKANQAALVEQFSERVYDIVTSVNTQILRGFEGQAIGGGRFVASLNR